MAEYYGLFRGVKADYTPETTHKDVVYFATDTQELLMNGTNYGGGSKDIELSELDTLDSSEDCGVYNVMYREQVVGTLMVNLNTALNAISQVIVGALSVSSGVIQTSVSQGISTIVTRTYINKAWGSWSDYLANSITEITSNIETLSDSVESMQSQLNGKADLSSVGAPNGIASLDADGKVPSEQVLNSAALQVLVDNDIVLQKYAAQDWGVGVVASADTSIKVGSKVYPLTKGYNEIHADTDSFAIDLNGTNYPNIDEIKYVCCKELTGLKAKEAQERKFDLRYTKLSSNVTSLAFVFANCSSLQSLDVSGWTPKPTSLFQVFSYCTSLKALDLSEWDVSNVGDSRGLFNTCSSLTDLNISGWDTSKWGNKALASTTYLFNSCSSLTNLKAGKEGTLMGNTRFNGCPNLTSASVDSIIAWLHDYAAEGATGNTITFHATTKAAMTSAQKQAITDKGWTLA